jgi:hypothetical protein
VDNEINAIFDFPSARETARWHHAAAGFPEKETFLKAIRNGNYSTWPGLNAELMSKHYPESVETKKGHMKGPRQGIKSTKVQGCCQWTTNQDGRRGQRAACI